jgi:hypothetical protein
MSRVRQDVKKIFSEAAARRTASRISDATSVRAGEMVSRQCLGARRIHYTRHTPSLPVQALYPQPYVELLNDARTKHGKGAS